MGVFRCVCVRPLHGRAASRAVSRADHLICVQLDSSGAIKMVPDSRGRTPQPGARSLSQLLSPQSAAFVDLVASMLVWDPTQRITPQEALQHPWVLAPDAPFRPQPQPHAGQPAQHRPQVASSQASSSRGARGPPVRGPDGDDAAGVQAVQLAQLHWQRHSLAKQAAVADVERKGRTPFAESGNVPHGGGSSQVVKGGHATTRQLNGALLD